MKKILIVTGSVRKGSVNSKVVEAIRADLDGRQDVETTLADLGELNLPFYNAATSPSVEGFEIEDEHAKVWSEQVKSADAVIFAVPEYNHGLSALQKNAIDWLYSEWTDKTVAFVAYGFYAGKHSLAQLDEMGSVINWKALDQPVGLQLTQDIDMDGTLLKEDEVRASIKGLVDRVLAAA